jgi:hypothetical protein
MFRQAEFKLAKEVLGRWKRKRNEDKEAKKKLKGTRKAIETLRDESAGGAAGGGISQLRLAIRQLRGA